MNQQIWKIAKWEDVFEKSDAARCEKAYWVSLPVSFESAGYHALLDEFGEDAPAIYGCWCALACVAARCPVRGVLSDSKGQGLKLSWISRQTGFPVSLFDRLIQWAASPSVQWLVSVPTEQFTVMQSQFQSALGQRRSRAVKKRLPESSGQNPDETANHPDGLPIHPDENACHPDSVRTTRQDKTSQNKTIHQSIDHGANDHHPDGRTDPMTQIVRDRWIRLKSDDVFLEEVIRVANKLSKLRHPALKLTREQIWQIAWTTTDLDRSVFEGCYAAIVNRSALKPSAYIDAAMRKVCGEKARMSWDVVRGLVPPAPTPSVPQPEPQEVA